ncbi:hypothetical protein DFH27DRAFT_616898 [Peziza echinospora]|nr:hypothetical protein DFH27DRAFT_616898 [Peziza echinospora]
MAPQRQAPHGVWLQSHHHIDCHYSAIATLIDARTSCRAGTVATLDDSDVAVSTETFQMAPEAAEDLFGTARPTFLPGSQAKHSGPLPVAGSAGSNN